MKKSLWGYNTREVEENFEYLELTNQRLEKQVKQLQAELKTMQEEGAQLAVQEDLPDYSDELRKNQEEIASLKEELYAVKQENGKLKDQVRTLSMRKDELEQVSNICRAAYEDMAHLRTGTKESLSDFTGNFWDKWNVYQDKMVALSEQIAQRHAESKEFFLNAADEILSRYSELIDADETIRRQLQETCEIKESVKSRVDQILADVDYETETPAVKEPEHAEAAQEELQGSALLQELNRRRKSAVPKEDQQIVYVTPKRTQPSAMEGKSQEMAKESSDHSETPVGIGISIGVNRKNIING